MISVRSSGAVAVILATSSTGAAEFDRVVVGEPSFFQASIYNWSVNYTWYSQRVTTGRRYFSS